jgi:hypothetical protein
MKQKIISVVIYAATALALAYFFDSLYGAAPITHHFGLIHTAMAGAILFVVAAVLSLFAARPEIMCAMVACGLSWPLFAGELAAILSVWRNMFSVVHYAYWGARLTAVLMLIISSIYSLNRSRLLFRAPVSRPSHKLG